MHEVFKIKYSKPFQKLYKNLINLKNPKHFLETPIFRSKNMKMHEKEGFGHLPSEEKLIKSEKSLRKRLGVREREERDRERSSKMRAESR